MASHRRSFFTCSPMTDATNLWRALGVSAVIHGVLIGTPVMPGPSGSAAIRRVEPRLNVALVAEPRVAVPDTPQLPTPQIASDPTDQAQRLTVAAAATTPSAAADAAMRALELREARSPPGRGSAELVIEGQPVVSLNVLPDAFASRALQDFPLELDSPVRVQSTLRARYPAGALADHREDSVVVWAVIDPEGRVDEIDVAQGAGEFGDAAIAALRTARFTPAIVDGKPVRFPVAFKFSFSIAAARPERSATAVRRAGSTISNEPARAKSK
jgi:TonB family protein